MAVKVVYFTVSGKNEQAEFRSEDSLDDVKDLFRAAAEANSHDILKLYNQKGNIVNISPRLEENTPSSRYRLEVVAAHYSGASVAAQMGFDLSEIEDRIGRLEKTVLIDSGQMPDIVDDMKGQVEVFRQKLECVDHLSWLGLYKDLSSGTSLQPFWNKQSNTGKKSDDHCKKVFEKFLKMSQVQVTKEVKQYLKKPTFDNWQWDDPEMMVLLRQMFIDLGLVTKFNIEMTTLHSWLYEIYRHYNNVPFHNFKHCFMVSQMMYGLCSLIDLPNKMDDVEILILLTSAICHDLDHPGYNNAYQINARTELALRYNDISPLENHHCSVAFEILEKPECNIFKNLGTDQFKRVREGMIRCILATDMAKHNEVLKTFRAAISTFDFTDKEHRSLLMMIMMKVADISNEARPVEVAVPWVDCLLEEFFNQLMLAIMKASDLSNEVRPVDVAEPWLELLLEEFFNQLMMICLKIADISNEVRPLEVAGPWLECLLQEYFHQSDMEKLEGLPVTPFMDREKVSKPSSQTGFIRFVLLPLFEALGDLFPVITDDVIVPVRKALEYYTQMQVALDEEKKRKEMETGGKVANKRTQNKPGAQSLPEANNPNRMNGHTPANVKHTGKTK